MPMEALDLELGKWLAERRPGILKGDLHQTIEALNALASVQGCLLATIKARSGDISYKRVATQLFTKADETARLTFAEAVSYRAPKPN